MKLISILLFATFFLASCSKPKVDPQPLSLIPANFKFVAKVKVKETLAIPGLGNRLRYERNRVRRQ